MTNITFSPWRTKAVAAISVVALASGLGLASAGPALAAPVAAPAAGHPTTPAVAPLTNLAHLDFLLDTATPPATAGHTTYALDSQPALTLPWVYADARPGGTFARVGGGPLDAATGHWGQGSYDADDASRAAVVYLRDWQQTGSATSKQKAYELLRSTAYFQTTTGPDAGNVVLWMQPDGTLNPSPVPVELPNPSDSGNSYWLARTLWAFGEGYAAFKDKDPGFASFLQQRLRLGVAALDRETLSHYGEYDVADGAKVPSWLIVGGADASAEAVLGLAAYSAAAPQDRTVRTALSQLSEGIADLGTKQTGPASTQNWPYGALLPGTESRSSWHAWASQMPAALALASQVLHRSSLLTPAVTDSVSFTTSLLTSGGPDNGLSPAPTDTTQIAYGADSRLQSLLAVADASHSAGIRQLAGVQAAWFFGDNASGKPVYNPATGVTFDGVQPNGDVNTGSGAESTIHGLLAMIALDAHPDVARLAQAAATRVSNDGLTVLEGEKAASTNGTVVTPAAANFGEGQWSGGAYLSLGAGQGATFAVPAGGAGGAAAGVARHVEPVIFAPTGSTAVSRWSAGAAGTGAGARTTALGTVRASAGAQGITPVPGALLPTTLPRTIGSGATTVSVRAVSGVTALDALLIRPVVSQLTLSGSGVGAGAGAGAGSATQLLQSSSVRAERATVGVGGTVRVYDSRGRSDGTRMVRAGSVLLIPAGGFAVVTR